MSWPVRIATLKKGVRLFPQASAGWDFTRGIYRIGNQQTRVVSALPGYNFTRALAAYAEDTSGNLIQFASGIPRITNKGVLIEEGRTNLLLRSQEFDSVTWNKVRGSISANAALAPDGTQTADLFVEDTSTSSDHGVAYAGGYASGAGTYTASIYAKPAGNNYLYLWLDNGSGVGHTVETNLTTGASRITRQDSSAWTEPVVTALPAGGGWWRIVVTAATTQTFVQMRLYTAPVAWVSGNYGTPTFTGGGVNGMYLWGAQVEAGSFATSYIPTTSASVTRPADVFYYSGLPALSSITVAMQVSANHTPSANEFPISLDDGTGNNRIQWFHGTATPNDLLPRVVIGGVASNPANITSGLPNSGSSIQAVAVSATRSMAAANGTLSSSGGTPSGVPPYTSLRVGMNENGSAWNNYIQRLAIYPFAASDAQLQSISSGNF